MGKLKAKGLNGEADFIEDALEALTAAEKEIIEERDRNKQMARRMKFQVTHEIEVRKNSFEKYPNTKWITDELQSIVKFIRGLKL